jgi:hypothetical protein
MLRPKTHPKHGLYHPIPPLLPVYAGEDGGGGGGDGGAGGGGQGDPAGGAGGGDGGKTFTQDDLNRIATREKAEGRKAALAEVAEQLGVSVDDAKALLAKAKADEDKTKSEADKEREKAAKEREDAARDREAAKGEVHQARLERAFAREGLDLTDDGAKAGRVLRMVTVEAGATYDEVLADVQTIKKDFPGLFGEDAGGDGKGKRKAPGSDPKGAPPKPTGGEDKFSAGGERAKALLAKRRRVTPEKK